MQSLDWGMILGGFGLFMFGIKFMGDGLKAVAGDKLKDYINRYTSNTVSAMLIGIVITIIMQSSSATSAISIGLVRAGLMTLDQAAGIILGATIGTTVTSFLISISIEKYAMYIAFVGTMMICFAKKHKIVLSGNVVLGFALIFFGMSSMGDALAALKEMPAFEAFALRMSENPLLAMLSGVGLTAAVQSSAATIGVAQKLYQAGAITFIAALPFMFGANIGTTMTGILASIGGSTAGKRTAALHTMINMISAVIGMVLLRPYAAFIQSIAGGLNPMMQIAVANIIFKTVTTLLFAPFIKQIVAVVRKIVPGEEPHSVEINIDALDAGITSVLPSAAIDAAQQAILQMVDVIRYNATETMRYMNEGGSEEDLEKLARNEAMINHFDAKITDYLIQLSIQPNLTLNDIQNCRAYLDAVKNFERVGDLATNLSEFFTVLKESNGTISEGGKKNINEMFDHFTEMFDLTAEVFVTGDNDLYNRLRDMEHEMDEMELRFRDAHFDRMANRECTNEKAISLFCDILGTIERMADHCCNVAKSSMTGMTSDLSDDEVVAATA
ncbi:MAG: Na/Pi cotransporter family protein [Solobacterium sp.]|nr:Na/Pi cotransporter family protein [Solobacterium sp.]